MLPTKLRLDPLLAIVVASILALVMAGLGTVTGASRQAAAPPSDQQTADTAQSTPVAGHSPFQATAGSCSMCGTVTVVHYIEQESEGGADGKQTTRRWDVVVAMDDGGSRTFSSAAEPSFRPGDRVMVRKRALMV